MFRTLACRALMPPICRLPGGQQSSVPPPLSLSYSGLQVLAKSKVISTPRQQFIFIHLCAPHMIGLPQPFPPPLTTTALYRSSGGLFGRFVWFNPCRRAHLHLMCSFHGTPDYHLYHYEVSYKEAISYGEHSKYITRFRSGALYKSEGSMHIQVDAYCL